jgi:tRNA(Ile)-lysidine synthase
MQIAGSIPDLAAAFAAAMARLGPFEPAPLLAVAVSGGADSLALALLAADWAEARAGTVRALVVDHRLRPESAGEAAATVARLGRHGIQARILPLTGLLHGPALAERARDARYRALIAACQAEGALHLLLGHHAGDQAETVAQRALRGSGSAGLAGMAALAERESVRLLRPLLDIEPERLRAYLRGAGIGWVEDPSNRAPQALRSRIRAGFARHWPASAAIAAVATAAAAAGCARAREDVDVARALGARVTMRPEGFAILPPTRLPLPALRALVQMIAGAPYPPPPDGAARLAAAPRPGTFAGVRLLRAGRMGGGLLMLREAAAMRPAVAAVPGMIWDGRFRIGPGALLRGGETFGALGEHAARFRGLTALPAAVLWTLPAFWADRELVAVPHLHYPDAAACARLPVLWAPRRPACGAPFLGVRIADPSTTTRGQGDAGQGMHPYVEQAVNP